LLQGEEPDLWGSLLVAFDLGGGVAAGHADAVLRGGPVEQAGEYLAVAVGGLGCEAAALDLAGDEGCDLGGGDLLEEVGFDDNRTPAAVLAGLGRALLRLGA